MFSIDNGSSVVQPPSYSTAPVPSATSVAAQTASGVQAGVKLDAAAVAEAQQKDSTAVRALTGTAIKVNSWYDITHER